MNYILLLIASFLFLTAIAIFSPTKLPYTCIKHCDGDTSHFQNHKGEVFKVRYEFMDADEKRQPFGAMASERLAKLVPIGSGVNIEFNGKDKFGRWIGTIYTKRLNVNFEMVSTGYAVAETDYKGDRVTKNQYERAEQYAKDHKLGRWKRHEWCKERPSEYRKRIKSGVK
ncbi:thermonuclease family protein [Pseudanabaena sp. 'Roaring Creek']|uniref:thermonuclease family protein n=1 Tax=Pseudanabaena sp. 'Roaring Creek' TaxID=1681830 RepID=UPI0006D7D2EA|nr:thermonuclease family protein [Pseudanabaena sp. 'Roaring Creek']